MSSLTKRQQKTLVYIAGFALSLALAGGLLYNLSTQRAQTAKLKQDVERSESQARGARLPSLEEQNKWTEDEERLNSILLTEQDQQQFFEEVTKAAADNGIQGLGMMPEEVIIDPNKAEDAKVSGVGIRRYLVVTLKFRGQYQDIARFLGAVSKLGRPTEYYSVNMKRMPPFIDVQIGLRVYKREPAA